MPSAFVISSIRSPLGEVTSICALVSGAPIEVSSLIVTGWPIVPVPFTVIFTCVLVGDGVGAAVQTWFAQVPVQQSVVYAQLTPLSTHPVGVELTPGAGVGVSLELDPLLDPPLEPPALVFEPLDEEVEKDKVMFPMYPN